jgi:hypothetical protein
LTKSIIILTRSSVLVEDLKDPRDCLGQLDQLVLKVPKEYKELKDLLELNGLFRTHHLPLEV